MTFRGIYADLFHPARFPGVMKWFLASLWLQQLAQSWLVVAMPFVIYSEGNQVFPGKGIVVVAFFIALWQASRAVTQMLTAQLPAHFGVRNSMILGQVVVILSFACFIFPLPTLVSLIAAAVFLGIGTNLMAASTWSTLAGELHTEKQQVQPSLWIFQMRMALVIAPLVGVLMMDPLGVQAPFWTAAACIVGSAICLAMLPSLRTAQYWQIKAWLRSQWPRFWHTIFTQAEAEWERFAYLQYWPIFLFSQLGGPQMAGYILSSASFVSVILSYLSGSVIDHTTSSGLFLRWRRPLLRALWLGRLALHSSPFGLVLIDTADRTADAVHHSFHASQALTLARSNNTLARFQEREFVSALACTVLAVLVALLSLTPWLWLVLLIFILATGFLKNDNLLRGL